MDHRDPTAAPIVYIFDPEKDLGDALAMLIESLGIPARAFISVAEWQRTMRTTKRSGPACLLFNGHQPSAESLAELERLADQGIVLPALLILDPTEVPLALSRARGPVTVLVRPFDHHALRHALKQCLAHTNGEVSPALSYSVLAKTPITPGSQQ